MTGTSFAQAITLLSAPALTRLYSSEDYGIMALFTSICSMLAVIACWRYELAIVLPDKDEEAANILILSVIINIGMSMLVFIIVAVFRFQIANLLGVPTLNWLLWFLPLNLLAAGLFQALNYWITRHRQFGRLALRQITQSFITVGTQLIAGLMRSGSVGLIGGSIIGQLTATGWLGWQILKEEGQFISKCVSLPSIKNQAKRYIKFPYYSSFTGLLNTVSQQIPGLLFMSFFGPSMLGHYYLAHRIFSIPAGIMSQAFSQAFYQKAAECFCGGENLKLLILKTNKTLIKIVFFPVILLFIFAPYFFEVIFGSEWKVSGIYLRCILPWLAIMFVVSPTTHIFSILNKQDKVLLYEMGLLFARLGAILLGAMILKSSIWAVILYGLAGALANLYLFLKINIIVDKCMEEKKC